MFNNGSGDKVAYCNTLQLCSIKVYEYEVKLKGETPRNQDTSNSINSYFQSIWTMYFYKDFTLYLPFKLRNVLLKLVSQQPKFSIIFKEAKNLQEHPELLRLLVSNADIEHSSLASNEHRLIPKLVTTPITSEFYPIGVQFYVVDNASLRQLIDTFKQIYADNYSNALKIELQTTYVYVYYSEKFYSHAKYLEDKDLFELTELSETLLVQPQDCFRAKLEFDKYQTASQLINTVQSVLSSKQFAESWVLRKFVTAKASVLGLEAIKFGDNAESFPRNGNWEIADMSNKPYKVVQLWCWCVFHTKEDTLVATSLATSLTKLGNQRGWKVGSPVFLQFENKKKGYAKVMNALISDDLQIFVILIPETKNKPDTFIKYLSCVKNPVPVLILRASELNNSALLEQSVLKMNTMVGGFPWSINFKDFDNTLICGIDVDFDYNDKMLAVCSSLINPFDWHTQVEIIDNMVSYLHSILRKVLLEYHSANPAYSQNVVIYQNCNKDNKTQLVSAYNDFLQDMDDNFRLCVVLVENDSNYYFFREFQDSFKNVPPGTVIDNTVLSDCYNFFLITKFCGNSVAAPTYYEVLHNETDFSKIQLQTLTYKLCHLNYEKAQRCAVPVPCYNASKVKKLVLEEIYYVPTSPTVNQYIHFL